MPSRTTTKDRSQPEKARFILRGGPQAGYIGDHLVPLPENLYTPCAPVDVADAVSGAVWQVATYRLTTETSEEPSIEAVYQFARTSDPNLNRTAK